MTFNANETTVDGFLGGRLQILQPMNGYRAATDPVFLAASVQAKSQDRVLELGCGVGVASLCLAARLPDVKITGLELQKEYAELARQNAAANKIAFEVVEGDLSRMPAALKEVSFDHVIINPPFFDKGSVSKPQNMGKATAHVIETELGVWIDASLKRLKPNGTITIIQLAEQLSDILVSLNERAGGVQILPLASRKGRAAKRVIVRAKKAARAPMKLLAPFHVHEGVEHVQGRADYTKVAAAVLRDGMALNWGVSS
jgi:tRNA1(Val) A37 N6-methylase TrmN6